MKGNYLAKSTRTRARLVPSHDRSTPQQNCPTFPAEFGIGTAPWLPSVARLLAADRHRYLCPCSSQQAFMHPCRAGPFPRPPSSIPHPIHQPIHPLLPTTRAGGDDDQGDPRCPHPPVRPGEEGREEGWALEGGEGRGVGEGGGRRERGGRARGAGNWAGNWGGRHSAGPAAAGRAPGAILLCVRERERKGEKGRARERGSASERAREREKEKERERERERVSE
jgi:hypothetical protein